MAFGELEEALSLACLRGNPRKVAELVAAGADIRARDPKHSGNQAIHAAATFGSRAVIEYLLENTDADLDATNDSGSTAFYLAALNGHESTLLTLYGKGANFRMSGREDILPSEAVLINTRRSWEDRTKTLKVLQGMGCEIPRRSRIAGRAVFLALRDKQYDTIRTLFEMGLDPDIGSKGGVPFLCMAASRQVVEAMEIAIESGADVNIQTTNRGFTPLHEVVNTYTPTDTEMAAVNVLLRTGVVDLTLKSSPEFGGDDAIELAKKRGKTRIARILERSTHTSDRTL